MSRIACLTSLLALSIAVVIIGHDSEASARAMSRVFVNGQPVPVYFNDGDSFRMYGGDFTGRAARLGGYNTLESYGPAHSWGNWHPYEMYILAKVATLHAARGVWHCTGDGSVDGYGRVLLDCPDLAISQIRHGYAHTMQVDDTPARPEYIRAQQEAMRERRGMWAHGVPPFVLTSLHSLHERPERATAYNRRVSTRDGHSEPWIHTDLYEECETVCATETVADAERVRSFARGLREDPVTAPALAELSNILLIEIVDRFARIEGIPEWVDPELESLLRPRLEAARSGGVLGETREERGACMLYVEFQRRYGTSRPACLRGHGERPEFDETTPANEGNTP